MYKQSSIDQVREADIITIISRYADLQRRGSLYECKSPFNPNEKSPSFKVSPAKNNFVCYSTQKKGDGIKFVMEKESCTFYEAIQKIAHICGIVLEREEETEEAQKKRSEKEELFRLMDWAAKKYQKALQQMPADHWTKKMIAAREISEETLLTFGIGFAPDDWKTLTNPIIETAKLELGKTSGLVNVKDGNSFDFFKNRLMFPIEDVNGNVIGFGGRCADDDPAKDNGRKYINSKESIVYSKSRSLYGIFQAKRSMVQTKTAVLTEGYTDVTALHQYGCDMALASGGTALTNEQCLLLKKFAAHVIICRDNDGFDAQGNPKAGTKAALEDINKLLANGFKVSVVIFPEGEDPDSYSRKHENIKDFIFENAQDAVLWKTTFLKNQAANDPDKLSEAVTSVAEMLYQIKDDIKHNTYVKDCNKILKTQLASLKQRINDFASKAIEKIEKGTADDTTSIDLGLPPGADFEEFKKYRFCTIGNSCWFQGRNGSFLKGTNYRITPLFHVYGKNDNKRLCEVVNENGSKKLIDFDSSDFVSQNKFDEALINEGYFVKNESFSAQHFTLMRNRILSDFIMAFELKTLGWQREGFFAFANCVYYKGYVKNVNEYGIVQVETEAADKSEYFEEVKHYYSPAFSEIYKHTRDDDDPYENDRYFVFKKSPVTMDTWMKQMQKVYNEKAIIGISSVFFSLFRDLFVKTHAVSPLLFLSGEKGSGKSKYAESLASLFTYKQPAFDLNGSTLVAFSRRIGRTRNAITLLEEFHDNIDLKILQSIKGSYDNRGRELGMATGDNRTKVAKVNCFLVMLSQYLSSWDDNAITSRSVIQHFIKPQENFTQQEINEYNLLKSWEEEGLTSLVLDIVEHREEVEKGYVKTYADIINRFKKDLKGHDYQERMLQNYVVIMTPITILWRHFTFPFEYEELYQLCKNAIIDSSDLIVESEGLAEFWKTLEYLLDRQPYPLLVKDTHFIIDKPASLKLQGRKGEKEIEWTNDNRKRVLFLRLNAVHQLYHKEVSTREGVDVIGENTLRNYFKSKKYFIGAVRSHRFSDTATSAYIFDYDMMEASGILNLIRNKEDFNLSQEDKEDDLPY
ncbi:MAG: DNA primase [Flavobacterium sp.]|uniref:DNA primase n=1 Tax=Flavobacterium sp. TaxID=239 RepID=UPI002B463989|nr:DNA primase [Flavobacterium sp.]WRH73359.1 MAG: DNA primase [Flavobacterium sp.]